MHGELVAFDLETTGLDVETDVIIEIGAVRLREGEVIDEFSSLVNPGFMISAEVSFLTGIEQDDVDGAPSIKDVLPKFENFVGDAPLIAHNIAFDISFLRKHKILTNNLPLDTYELAALLLPTIPRYNLSSLTEYFEISLEHAHRALDDARATAYLYWHLWQKASKLPAALLSEITRYGSQFQWDAGEVFKAALQHQQGSPDQNQPLIQPAFAKPEPVEPLIQENNLRPLDPETVDQLIGESGKLNDILPDYEIRPQQQRMAHEIAHAFSNSKHLIIEAGTGTGKSLAYLVPVALWATQNQQRVVISTNTTNLQEQLIQKDVPLVEQILDDPFRATVLKGRGHYLCPRRLAAVRRRDPGNMDELLTLTKILIWLQESTSGDRGELTLRANEYPVWRRLSAEDEGCSTENCRAIMGGICPFHKSRLAAEASQVVIVNHALLIADARSENHVIPDYRHLVVDEAHQLEDAVTDGLTVGASGTMLRRRLDELGGPDKGILGDLLRTARKSLPDKAILKIEAYTQSIGEAVRAMQVHVQSYYKSLHALASELQRSDFPQRTTLIGAAQRGASAFGSVQAQWRKLDEFFEVLSDAMQHLTRAVQKLKQKHDVDEFDDHIKSTGASATFLAEVRDHLHHFTLEPDANTIYWLSSLFDGDLSVVAAPLHIGPYAEAYLWQAKESTVLTSATLRTEMSFDHIQDRLYADHVKTMAVGSPFDYKESTLIYLPEDIPEPNQQGYQKAVERGIIELAAELDGRVMVLFTSYAQLKETAREITPRLSLGNIAVYDQAGSSSREALLEGFKSTEKAVLLGTKSFWQGVDIPGESLSALVIVRLPFAVPSDPIFASRSETYENSFREYAVPDAILRFRQGFGRLIRTKTDRGVVTIFDKRIISKRYGQHFLESLPDCTVQTGRLAQLPQAASRWLSKEDIE